MEEGHDKTNNGGHDKSRSSDPTRSRATAVRSCRSEDLRRSQVGRRGGTVRNELFQLFFRSNGKQGFPSFARTSPLGTSEERKKALRAKERKNKPVGLGL